MDHFRSEVVKTECEELGTTQTLKHFVEGSLINIDCFLTSMVPHRSALEQALSSFLVLPQLQDL